MPFARVCWAAGIHDHNPVPVGDYLFVGVTVQDYVYWFFELFSHRFLAIGVRKYEISAVGARRNLRSRPLDIVNHTD